jgi:hypothetical protein
MLRCEGAESANLDAVARAVVEDVLEECVRALGAYTSCEVQRVCPPSEGTRLARGQRIVRPIVLRRARYTGQRNPSSGSNVHPVNREFLMARTSGSLKIRSVGQLHMNRSASGTRALYLPDRTALTILGSRLLGVHDIRENVTVQPPVGVVDDGARAVAQNERMSYNPVRPVLLNEQADSIRSKEQQERRVKEIGDLTATWHFEIYG